jgi:Mrp family chromosome partitioning ATPase
MEHIRQAVELAQARGAAKKERTFPRAIPGHGPQNDGPDGGSPDARSVLLNHRHLESMRIIAYDVMDYRSKPFDMLRTQVVREMTEKNWRTIAVTSPTAGCGKTVTAINLALSIARQLNNSVFVVDMDLQRPRVATSLGIKCTNGLIGVLEGRATLSDATLQAQIGNYRIRVLPCETSTSYSSEWMASPQVRDIIQNIKSDHESQVSIIDLPPILTSDDVISVLPQLDCVLLVTAVGVSTLSDVEQCKRHLQSTEVVRVVLNKTVEKSPGYYY